MRFPWHGGGFLEEEVSFSETTAVFSLSLDIDGSLIDFETTGVPSIDPDSEVVALGYYKENKVTVMQRISKKKRSFYGEITQVIDALPRPFYAYNAQFEKAVMTVELGIEVSDSDFVDIMKPWRAKAETQRIRWPRLDELVSEPEDYFFGSRMKVRGSDIPGLWQEYLHNRTALSVRMIMEHCLSDILREVILFVRYQYIMQGEK